MLCFVITAGDWLQGPYVYYLYSTYGFGKGDIGQLFIDGFGSSMLFGTIVGSLADKQWETSFFLFNFYVLCVLSDESSVSVKVISFFVWFLIPEVERGLVLLTV